MNSEILVKAQEWTKSPYDKKTQDEIKQLIEAENESELTDRFWQDLEFGTGGIRGIRGAGINRMNVYNIRKVTQGLAQYILIQSGGRMGVVIGRDSRINSLEFAQEAATILVNNNINVYFFKNLAPTPVISYAIKKLGAKAGVMNTASHNPKEYNGYKVYWEDGAQLTPPHDHNVIAEIRKINNIEQIRSGDFSKTEQSPYFHYCDHLIEEYLDDMQKSFIDKKLCAETDLKVLYSPLHGCGYEVAPMMFEKLGFKNFSLLKEQAIPDGTFPTAPYPNPEDEAAMTLGTEYAKANDMDLFIATDPDADRIGVVYKNSTGKYERLNGNQIGVLMLDYALRNKPKDRKSFVISTIVSTPLSEVLAKEADVDYYEVLTGFRWISSKMIEQTKLNKEFLFSFEESHGYNVSPKVFDKDGITAAAYFAELTAFHKKEGYTLDSVLLNIAIKNGYYKESQHSVTLKGKDGVEQIRQIMENLRSNTPKKVLDCQLIKKIDYQNDTTGLPNSNVVALFFEENIRIVARPSGTEPKLKFYFSSHGEVACMSCVNDVNQEHELIIKDFLSQLKLLN